MQHLSTRFLRLFGLLVVVALVPGQTRVAGTYRPEDPGFDGLWKQGIDLVEHGRFDSALDTFRQVPAGEPPTDQIRTWLEEYNAKQAARIEADRADFEKYIRYAKQRIEREEYRKALEWALAASDCAEDREAFLRADWLSDLVNHALEQAVELRTEAKWREAWRLYWPLAELFDREPRYEQLEREVLTHLRLDIVFEEDNDWREGLEKVRWEDAESALEAISFHYVEPADFKSVTERALEQLLLLAESKSARERDDLAGLRDEDARRDFQVRVQRKLEQVRAEPSLTWRETQKCFRRVVLDVNRETIQLPEELIVSELMRGALEPLDDFTTIIWPQDAEEFDRHTRGDFIGVGISIIKNRVTDEIEVVTPLEDAPAYWAGIQAGDIILKADDRDLKEVSLNKAVDIITGPVGTMVTLTIRRGEEEIDFPLKRARVKIQSVKGIRRGADEHWEHWLDKDNGIGYVRVASFQKNTVGDVKNVLADLNAHGLKGLVLDLRSNPGGLLDSAWEMSSLFLGAGENVVSTRGRYPRESQSLDTRGEGPYSNLPTVVLVDEQSASASEIVAGAIKDNHHGVVVGARTFGKFSVQNLITLSRRTKAKLKLTTARYYLPSGVSLHREPGSDKWGVEPQIPVRLVPKEKMKLWTVRRNADRIGPPKPEQEEDDAEGAAGEAVAKDDTPKDEGADADEPANDDEVKDEADVKVADAEESEEDKLPPLDQPDENDRPEADPQLDTALLVMRVALLGERYPTLAAARTETAPAEPVRP